MPRCEIALGGNLGAVEETFDRALRLLSRRAGPVTALSRVYGTRAVGDRAGDPFRNAAAQLSTDLRPLDLLDVLQAVETDLGRMRERRWAPRTIDLDLIFYGDEILENPRLTVPHPSAWYRRFVLDPLEEIAPDVVHPVKQLTVHELRARLLPRPLPVRIAGGENGMAERLARPLQIEFPAAELSSLSPRIEEHRDEVPDPALILWIGSGTAVDAKSAKTFLELPALPRLDVTSGPGTIEETIRDALRSALG